MMITLKNYARRFRDEEDGVIAVEFLLMAPLIVWTMLSTVVYFDAFRDKAISHRASLVIADMISREKNDVPNEYFDNTLQLLYTLAGTGGVSFRITSYRFIAADDEYKVLWSEIEEGPTGESFTDGELDNAELAALRDSLPLLSNCDSSYLIETLITHEPVFKSNISIFPMQANQGPVTFRTFVPIRPRFLQGGVGTSTKPITTATTSVDPECGTSPTSS